MEFGPMWRCNTNIKVGIEHRTDDVDLYMLCLGHLLRMPSSQHTGPPLGPVWHLHRRYFMVKASSMPITKSAAQVSEKISRWGQTMNSDAIFLALRSSSTSGPWSLALTLPGEFCSHLKCAPFCSFSLWIHRTHYFLWFIWLAFSQIYLLWFFLRNFCLKKLGFTRGRLVTILPWSKFLPKWPLFLAMAFPFPE
jgi:hypothetical protein